MKPALLFVLMLAASELADAQGNRTIECGRPYLVESKVIRSAFAPFGELPWHVGIYGPTSASGTTLLCEGVLIHERYVLTAAKCVNDFKAGFLGYKVRSGDFDLDGYPHEDYKLRRKIVHEKFSMAPGIGFVNDIALLELTEAVTFKEHIIPICLPSTHVDFNGQNATTTGWGPLNDTAVHEVPLLHKFDAQVVESESCSAWFLSDDEGTGGFKGFLCVQLRENGTGPCRVGSPLIQEREGRYQVIGIASGDISEKCRDSLSPSFYTNVSNYVDWINSNIQHHSEVETVLPNKPQDSAPAQEELEKTLREVKVGLVVGFIVVLILVAVLALAIAGLLHYTEVTKLLKHDFNFINAEPQVFFTRSQGLMSRIADIRSYGIGVAMRPYE